MAMATRWSEYKAPGTWPRPPGGMNSKHQVRGQGHVRETKRKQQRTDATQERQKSKTANCEVRGQGHQVE